jgi:hypothetical protein
MKVQFLLPLSPVVALAALFFVPASGFAQSSILNTASSFTLLGGTAITNTGASTEITGSVGSPTITGLPATQVTGSEITTDPTLSNAQSDLEKAATGLAGMTPTQNLSAINGGNLGGQTLLPGVYYLSAPAAFTGTLTLNANGENNAYWVFQFGAAFTSAASASVVVTGLGSLASNNGSTDGIFWVDENAAFTFGANTIVLGNYLAPSAAINLGAGDTGSGGSRMLASAAVTLASSQLNALGGPGGSGWTGGLKFSGNNVVPIPEPAAFLWFAPLGAIGFALWRRRSVGNKIAA